MKTQNPWMGRFRGSAGNMTGCKVYDKNVLRAKAFEVANPNTQAQQVQRNFFKSLSQLVATFSDEQLRTLFSQKPKAMSRRNALSRQIAGDYDLDNGQKIIDFTKITTLGNAQTMDFGNTICENSRAGIQVTLDSVVSNNTSLQPYHFIVALVNATRGQIYMPLVSATVQTGNITIDSPSNWDTSDDVFAIPFVTNSMTDVATVGFGTLAITKRPEKKPRNRPAPFEGLTVYCSGLTAWSTFEISTVGTPYAGGTISALLNGNSSLCESVNTPSEDVYTGSFLIDVDESEDSTAEVRLGSDPKMYVPVRFIVSD